MMTRNKNIAGAVLAACAAGAALTYPYQGSNVGYVVFHGLSAATIGGLADWYAVTALFRKPLGFIGYRTEVVPRNRERLMGALTDFLCEDLLSAEHITKALSDSAEKQGRSFPRILVDGFLSGRAVAEVKTTAIPLLIYVLERIDKVELEEKVRLRLKTDIPALELTKIALTALKESVEKGYAEPLVEQLLRELDRVLDAPEVKRMITERIKHTFTNYSSQGTFRELVLSYVDSDYSKWTEQLIAKGHAFLADLIKDKHHVLREKVRQWCTTQLEELEQDRDFTLRVDTYLTELITAKSEEALRYFYQVDEATLRALVEQGIAKVRSNATYLAKAEQWLGQAVEQIVQASHSSLTATVREKLASYSTEEVVELIEGKVGDDLQMIRVNGSVIGGLVGMLLATVTLVVEGVLR